MHKPASNDAVTSLHDLSAVDLLAGFRAKQFSPSDVLEDVLAHIAVWEPHIKALYAFDPDGARTVAKASTERWPKSEPTGALDGAVRLPARWRGMGAVKPSLGRIPIDPFYVGRVAGPMTRIADDAALMMSVVSRPDRRDGMSLPPDNINWKALDKPVRKLRIGLMLDLGVGQALEKEVRAVAVKAAKAFESAGAVVTEVDGILTREMLDGLDNFWRARMWDDLAKLDESERAKALPYIVKWGESATKLGGVDVIRAFNATMAIRTAAAKLFCDLDYVISPVSPVVNLGAELASLLNDPEKPFEHIAYTVPWN